MLLQPLHLAFLEPEQGGHLREGIVAFSMEAQLQHPPLLGPELTQMAMQPVIGFFHDRPVISADQIEQRLIPVMAGATDLIERHQMAEVMDAEHLLQPLRRQAEPVGGALQAAGL